MSCLELSNQLSLLSTLSSHVPLHLPLFIAEGWFSWLGQGVAFYFEYKHKHLEAVNYIVY